MPKYIKDGLTFMPTNETVETVERLNELVEQLKAEASTQERERILELIKSKMIFTTKGRQKGTYKLTEQERLQIMQLHEKGISNRKLADTYGINEKTVRNYLKIVLDKPSGQA